MTWSALLLLLVARFAVGNGSHSYAAGMRTICTITVNSSDEKEMFTDNE